MTHSLKNIAILHTKGATFTCVLMGISKNKGLKRSNNSVTYDKGALQTWILYQKLVQYKKLSFFFGIYIKN